MRLDRFLETSLFVADPLESQRFYRDVLGLRLLASNSRIVALTADDGHVLLLFRKGGSTHPVETPGGVIPAGDADGQMHIAFAVSEDALQFWEERLSQLGIEIESKVDWSKVPWEGYPPRSAGRSLYFRDPDGHSLELATPGVWPGVY